MPTTPDLESLVTRPSHGSREAGLRGRGREERAGVQAFDRRCDGSSRSSGCVAGTPSGRHAALHCA